MQPEAAQAEGEGLAHTIPVPPITDTTGPLQKISIPEPTLVDVLLCDHQHTLALLDHFTLAAAQGNTHAMELLAGALALDLRLHLQAEADILQPMLDTGPFNGAGESWQPIKRIHQALEGNILEVLTCRREQNWKSLAAAVQQTHQDFASHVQKEESETLPLLVQQLSQVQLTVLAGRYHVVKRTATLLPHVNVVPSGRLASGEAAMEEEEEEEEEEEAPKVSFTDRIDLPEPQPET